MPGLNQLQQTRRPGPNLRDSSLGMQSGTPQAPKSILPSLSKPLISNKGIQQSVPDSGPNMSVDVPVQTTSKARSKDRFKEAIIKGESTGLSREEAYKKIKDAGYTLEPGKYDNMSPRVQKMAERQDKVVEAVTVNKNNQNPLVRGFKGLVGGIKGAVEGAVEGVKKGVPQLRKDTKATIKDPSLSAPEKFMGVLFKEVLADFVSTDVIGGAVVGGAKGAAKGIFTEQERAQAKNYMSTFIKEGSTVDQAIMKYNSLPPEEKKKFDYYAGGLLGLVDLMGAGAGKKVGKELLEQGAETVAKVTDVPGQVMGDISTDVTKGVENIAERAGQATDDIGTYFTRDYPIKTIENKLNLTPKERALVESKGETAAEFVLRKQIAGLSKAEQVNQLDAIGDAGYNGITEKLKGITDRVESDTAKKMLETMSEEMSKSKILAREMGDYIERLDELKSQADYSPSELQSIKRDFSKIIGRKIFNAQGRVTDLEDEVMAGWLRDVGDQVEDIGAKYGIDIKDLNGDVMKSIIIRNGLLRRMSQENKNNVFSLQDLGVGAILSAGDPITATALIIGKKGLEKYTPAISQRLYNLSDRKNATNNLRRGVNFTPRDKSRGLSITPRSPDGGTFPKGPLGLPAPSGPTPIPMGGLPQQKPSLFVPERPTPPRNVREINVSDTGSYKNPVPKAPGTPATINPVPVAPGSMVKTEAMKTFDALPGEKITDVSEFKKGYITPDGEVTEVGFSGRQPYYKVEGDIKHRVRTKGVAKKPVKEEKVLDSRESLDNMTKAGQRNSIKIEEGMKQIGIKSLDELNAEQLKIFGDLVRARNFNDAWYKKLEDLKKDVGGENPTPSSLDSTVGIDGKNYKVDPAFSKGKSWLPEKTGTTNNPLQMRGTTTERLKELAILHNLNAEDLVKIQKLGGMPMPSIAITERGISFDEFGDITLVGNKDLVTGPGAKLYTADAYTPRVPEATSKLKPSTRINKEVLKRISKETGMDEWDVQQFFADTHGNKDYMLRKNPELAKYLEFEDDIVDKKLFAGFTNNGRKYVDYNIANVLKEMKKKGKGNESAIFAGNLHQMMGKNAKQVTFNQAKKLEYGDRLKFEEVYNKQGDKYMKKLEEIATKNDKSTRSLGSDLSDAWSSSSERTASELQSYGYKNVTAADIDVLRDIIEETTKLPKSYIEAKIARAVGIGEFQYALVPEDQVAEVKKILRGTPLEDKIVGYKKGEARNVKLEELQKKHGNVFFSVGGALIPIGALAAVMGQ